MKKKSLLIIFIALAFSSCASSNNVKTETLDNSSYEEKTDEAREENYMDVDESTKEEGSGIDDFSFEDKKEKIYDIDLESINFDKDLKAINDIIKDTKGNIISQHYNSFVNDGGSLRNIDIEVKIPRTSSKKFKEEVEAYGRLASSNEYINDLNKPYKDVNRLLVSKKNQLAKLKELNEKAENIEDTLAIQAKIFEVEGEIDQIEKDIKDLDERVLQDTFNIYLREVYSYGKHSNENPNLRQRLGEAVGESFSLAKIALANLMVGLVLYWPFIIIALIILILIIWKRRKNKKVNKN